jgi:hypothetical protein
MVRKTAIVVAVLSALFVGAGGQVLAASCPQGACIEDTAPCADTAPACTTALACCTAGSTRAAVVDRESTAADAPLALQENTAVALLAAAGSADGAVLPPSSKRLPLFLWVRSLLI